MANEEVGFLQRNHGGERSMLPLDIKRRFAGHDGAPNLIHKDQGVFGFLNRRDTSKLLLGAEQARQLTQTLLALKE